MSVAAVTTGAVTTGAVSTVSALGSPATAVVVLGSAAYVATLTGLNKVNLADGTVTTITTNDGAHATCTDLAPPYSAGGLADGRSLTTDGQALWITDSCGIRRLNPTNGAIATVLPGSFRATTVGPNGKLYTVSTALGSAVLAVDPVNGTTSTLATLAAGESAAGITSDSAYVYVNAVVPSPNYYTPATHRLVKIALATGTSTTLTTDSHLGTGNLQAAGDYLYTGGYEPGSTYQSVLRRYSKTGGTSWDVAGFDSVPQDGSGSLAGYRNGIGDDALFASISDVTSDGTALYVADGNTSGYLRKVVDTSPLPFTQEPAASSARTVTTGAVSTAATFSNGGQAKAAVILGGAAYVATLTEFDKVNLSDGTITTITTNDGAHGTCTDSARPYGGGGLGDGRSLATDGQALWVTDSCGIRRLNPTNGAIATVLQGGFRATTVGPNGKLYTVQNTVGGAVLAVDPVNGTTSTLATLAAGESAAGITSDSAYVYVNAVVPSPNYYTPPTHRLVKIALAGGTSTTLTTDSHLGTGNLQAAGDYLYTGGYEPGSTYQSVLRRYSKTGGTSWDVAGFDSVPQDGSGSLAGYRNGIGDDALFASISDVTSDGTALYVADGDTSGYLRKVIDTPAPPTSPGSGRVQGGPVFQYESVGGTNPSENTAACQRCHGDPINTATGSYTDNHTDLAVPGRGVPLAFARSYDSQVSLHAGPLGYGWTHGYDAHLVVDRAARGSALSSAGAVDVVQENGSSVAFTRNSAGGYDPPTRVLATLTRNADGSYTFTRRARLITTFNAAGRLVSQGDLNGNVTRLAYDLSGRLSTITEPAGRWLEETLRLAEEDGNQCSRV